MKFTIEPEFLPDETVLFSSNEGVWLEAKISSIEHRIACGVNGIHHYWMYWLSTKSGLERVHERDFSKIRKWDQK